MTNSLAYFSVMSSTGEEKKPEAKETPKDTAAESKEVNLLDPKKVRGGAI